MSLNFNKSTRRIILTLLFVVVGFSGLVFWKHTKGQGVLPFGGKVILSLPCTCNGVPSVLLTVSPPVGGQFLYILGSQLYRNYNLGLATGMNVLGLYTPGGVCMVYAGKGCVPIGPPIGTISPTVGTSLSF